MSPTPSQLIVLPARGCNASRQPAATVQDHAPIINIAPFGPCNAPAFPPTASATAAASGVLTPMPCVPNTTTPWSPGSTVVKIARQPALLATDTCQCAWGGTITVVNPGQIAVEDQ